MPLNTTKFQYKTMTDVRVVVISVVDVVVSVLVLVSVVVVSVEVVLVSVVVMSVLEAGVQHSCNCNVLRELRSLVHKIA